MIWIIGTVIGIMYLALSFLYFELDSKIEMALNCLWAVPLFLLLSFIGGCALSFLAGLVGLLFMPTEEVVLSETPIYSVVDSSEYEGHFVLGSGYADSDLKIYYVTETDEGKKIHSANRGDVTIVETDAEQPKAVSTGRRYKYHWLNFFFFDMREVFGSYDVILTVPKDTITVQYNIDFK